jgi:MFS family permease
MAGTAATVALGAALWGLHMGLTQGILASLVADTAPEDLRGTAFGLFNLITGLATLAASVIAGVLWDVAGPATTFFTGAIFTVLALCVVPVAYRMIAPP